MDEKELFELVGVNRRCPKCDGETRQTEKDTASGREMREFQCQACGWQHIFEMGPALWTVFADLNQEARASTQAAPLPAPLKSKTDNAPEPPVSARRRIFVILAVAAFAAALLLLIRFG